MPCDAQKLENFLSDYLRKKLSLLEERFRKLKITKIPFSMNKLRGNMLMHLFRDCRTFGSIKLKHIGIASNKKRISKVN